VLDRLLITGKFGIYGHGSCSWTLLPIARSSTMRRRPV
jgi:hypothetical protein